MGEAERGDAAPRVRLSFYCAHGHESRPAFAVDAPIPDTWDCPVVNVPYKTHLAYVKERRDDKDGDAILAEAIDKLRGDR
jgi:hypothetical protein